MATMIRVHWDGRVYTPIGAHPKSEIGNYRFLREDELDDGFRSYFFVRLKELYDNLPERLSKRFQNITHFRAWCLIHEGAYNEVVQHFPTRARAEKAAVELVRSFQLAIPRDDTQRYVVTSVKNNMLLIWTAKSLARKGGMSNEEWKSATRRVLELAEHLVTGDEYHASPTKGHRPITDRRLGARL